MAKQSIEEMHDIFRQFAGAQNSSNIQSLAKKLGKHPLSEGERACMVAKHCGVSVADFEALPTITKQELVAKALAAELATKRGEDLAGGDQVKKKSARKRTPKGNIPEWLLPAGKLIQDTNGSISDAEIARRVGVDRSTLSRHKEIKRLRKLYFRPLRNALRNNEDFSEDL